jgi:integrase
MTKRRSDGDGSLYCRHKKDCPERGREKAKCKCPWQAAYVIGWRDGKPVRKKVTGPTRNVARNLLDDLKAKYATEDLPADGKAITVEQWMTYWYTRVLPRSGAKPYTLAGYNAKVNQYIIPLLGPHRLDKLTPEHIEDAWDRLRDEGNPTKAEPTPLSANTIHQTHRILSRALKVAVQRKKLRTNPAGASMMDAPPRVERELDVMAEDEVDKILDACRGQWNAARWNVALAIGLRQGEALGLRWDDVDLEAGILRVRQTLMRVTGQGIVFGTPKSTKSRRDIPLPASLLDNLKAHRKAQTEARLHAGSAWADSGLVFTHKDGRPIDPSVDAGRWRKLLAEAGVRHYRLHDARHSAGTLMVAEGVDIRVAMAILGHSQISVTMRYQHAADQLLVDAAQKLDRGGRWA